MTLRTRLGLGFFVVILVVLAIGATSYLAFARVGASVRELGEHRQPLLQHAVNIERLALEACGVQKEIVQREAPAPQKLGERLDGLSEELRKLHGVAAAHHDAGTSTRAVEAAEIVRQYRMLLARSLTALEGEQREYARISAKGNALYGAVDELASFQTGEGQRAGEALVLANATNVTMLDARLYEKKYLASHRPEDLDQLEEDAKALGGTLADLQKLHPAESEMRQLAAAQQQVQQYLQAVRAGVDKWKQDPHSPELPKLEAAADRAGDAVGLLLDEYTTCKQGATARIARALDRDRRGPTLESQWNAMAPVPSSV